jgi:hypothetical protein
MSEEPKTCGTCRHWGIRVGSDIETDVDYRTCRAVKHVDRSLLGDPDPEWDEEDDIAEKKKLREEHRAVVVDGSDYYAALKPKQDFGCVLHEPEVSPGNA